jgi:hypothetical protein
MCRTRTPEGKLKGTGDWQEKQSSKINNIRIREKLMHRKGASNII